MQRTFIRLAFTMLAVCLSACGGAQKRPRPPAHAHLGVLVPSEELKPPFVVEQHLSGQYGSRDIKLDCVVQVSNGKLSLLGLTPFGTKAFLIEQVGTDVRFENYVSAELPFEPVQVLYDLHRVFFRGLSTPRQDGTWEEQEHGDMVRERWENGSLVERRFESLEGPVSNIVVVTYGGPPAPVIARHVTLTNVAYGYTLKIDNLEQKTLEGGYTLEVESSGGPPPPPPPRPE
ncbi:MAG: DUF3261 domain-containing protein [Polyangiales bacterium]